MPYFKINDIIKLKDVAGVKGGKIGDLAVVVDGKKEFPKLYEDLERRVSTDLIEFVWVKWTGPWPYRPDLDGAYRSTRFELAPKPKGKN